ncbi:hypothetical protein EV426DRAFT_614068 [Tirmania nivea]|nr:hypothetical protein EV426DRAFT_614068 [Tirmania nivea]
MNQPFSLSHGQHLLQYDMNMNPNRSKSGERKKPKKPFHIKKADLRLDEYKQEISDGNPGLLLREVWQKLFTSRQFHMYLLIQAIAAGLGCGQMMLCIGTDCSSYLYANSVVLTTRGM